jgi:hypothetical protein
METWRQGQSPRDYHVQSLHKGLVRHSVPFTWRSHPNHTRSQSLSPCAHQVQLLRCVAVFARSNAQVSTALGGTMRSTKAGPVASKAYPGGNSAL